MFGVYAAPQTRTTPEPWGMALNKMIPFCLKKVHHLYESCDSIIEYDNFFLKSLNFLFIWREFQ